MSIKAEIIADSSNPVGCRLTTFLLEYPRYIHSELMTHRMFSKNAASSRAIPIEKMIQQVIDNPAMPVWWGKNQSGMQAKEELDDLNKNIPWNLFVNKSDIPSGYDNSGFVTALQAAKLTWLESRDKAIKQVQLLSSLGLHKQIANRILEPWFNIRIVFSGTDFENFFALRAHEDAQPEFQVLAKLMLEEYNKSTPKPLQPGEWHIPFGDKIDDEKLMDIVADMSEYHGDADIMIDETKQELKKKIAVARCARISYYNYEGKDDYAADIKLCDRLFGSIPRHLSPTEHIAQAMDSSNYVGNFKGFKQYRKFFTDENLTDSRVIKK